MTIAYWCILAAGILPQMVGLYAKIDKTFDNNDPRVYLGKLEGAKARAVAAMENGYEGLPLFIAAVIIAHLTGANQTWIDTLAVAYLISRVLFSIIYISGKGTLRSLVWTVGLGCIIGLFVISA